MDNVETYRPPASVSFEGKALSVVTQLSKAAILLSEVVEQDNVPDDARDKIQNAVVILNNIIDIMSAVETTLDRFEARADQILEVLTDGEQASFCNRGSQKYFVSGVMTRRLQTIAINIVGFAENVPSNYANLNVSNNIILLRGTKRSAQIAFRVAC